MAENGLERRGRRTERGGRRKEPCGEEDTHKALMITYFCCPSGKIKICGDEKLVLQEHQNPMGINWQLPPVLPPIWQ